MDDLVILASKPFYDEFRRFSRDRLPEESFSEYVRRKSTSEFKRFVGSYEKRREYLQATEYQRLNFGPYLP